MKNQIELSSYASPVGSLLIGVYQSELILCDWEYRRMRNQIDNRLMTSLEAEFSPKQKEHELFNEVKKQLEAYFSGSLQEFDLPLNLIGTSFQQEVWSQLQEIPFGKTRSYLDLSNELGNPKAIRAVASANGANAISIIVPCHRIIGSDGSLVGYAGGLAAKRRLLSLEGAFGQIQLDF
ncbi:methylated-DNA--[protein]-cysteine S-methyltransferase [Flavobacteriaceae bacterium]|nr:methylated-DNA--[protein]-cysteine S-methyltransferase [Flavobacteriaceae bacterium]